MTGVLVCILCYFFVLRSARRGLGHGFGAVLAVGYLYGIVRARVLDSACHFMFDVAVFALYFERAGHWTQAALDRSRYVMPWLTLLVAWPILIFLVPQQHPIIQLVGLRAAIYFLPFVALGARTDAKDLDDVSLWMALLNLGALGVAVAEYLLGIERFFPHNAVTQIMYQSIDLAGHQHRIPATFTSAHAYAGTMVATLPFLLSRWQAGEGDAPRRVLYSAAIVGSSFGVFMTGARLPVVILFLQLGLVFTTVKLPSRLKAGIVVFGAIVAVFVAQDPRFQRFLTLRNTEYVATRLGWSVNMNFFEMLLTYPAGAGLGSAAGTSIPYFLMDLQTRPQIGMENEYGRIAVEQSLVGLALWVIFIAKTVARRWTPVSKDWALGMRLMKVLVLVSWASALIGTGMLTAIPQTPLLLFTMGLIWRARPRPVPVAPRIQRATITTGSAAEPGGPPA